MSHPGSHAEASTSRSTSDKVAWLCQALKALVQPDSQWFDWKYGSKIHYRYAPAENALEVMD